MASDYKLKRILGQGGSSTVYEAEDLTGRPARGDSTGLVAIKVSPLKYCKEASLLSSLSHENIITLLDSYSTGKFHCLVLEYCDMSLLSFIKEYEVDEEVCLKITRMILLGLHHIHSKGIIHRDIKLSNILLKGNVAKICDFGLSCYEEENSMTYCGTENYIAPEVRRGEYSKEVDIWGVGRILSILLKNSTTPSSTILDLQRRLLDPDSKTRITVEDALRHPVFKKFMPKIPSILEEVGDFTVETKYGVIKKRGGVVEMEGVTSRDDCVYLTNSNLRKISVMYSYLRKALLKTEGRTEGMAVYSIGQSYHPLGQSSPLGQSYQSSYHPGQSHPLDDTISRDTTNTFTVNLKRENIYKFIDGLGWCIKDGLFFTFLFFQGQRVAVDIEKNTVYYKEVEYRVDGNMKEELKRLMKKVLVFLYRIVRV